MLANRLHCVCWGQIAVCVRGVTDRAIVLKGFRPHNCHTPHAINFPQISTQCSSPDLPRLGDRWCQWWRVQ